jgi:hypothetical protein
LGCVKVFNGIIGKHLLCLMEAVAFDLCDDWLEKEEEHTETVK